MVPTSPKHGFERRLRAFWEECGVHPRQGLSPEAMAAVGSQLSCVLPASVESLYGIVDGIGETGEGDDLFTVWPLREWRRVVILRLSGAAHPTTVH
jgi:hypothetical protein